MADDKHSSGSEADEVETEDVRTSNKMAAFQLLMDEEEDVPSPQSGSEEENTEKQRETIAPKTITVTDQKKKKKPPKKKDKKGGGEDEDLDAVLAEINAPTVKETKQKGGRKEKPPADSENHVADPELPAQPPAAEEGKKKKKKKKKEVEEKVKEDENVEEVSEKQAEEASGETGEAEKEDGETSKKKDKKKKKKDKDKEETSGKKKKAHVSAIKEFLRKKLEEEERLRREAEEEEERLEEAARLKEEELRKEQERKERIRENKKAREEEAKRTGTYLTDKEKKKRAQDQARLEELTRTGMVVPGLEPKKPGKRPVYENKLKKHKQQEKQKSHTPEEEKAPVILEETKEPETPQDSKQTEKEGVADAWDADDDDVADSWELTGDEEVGRGTGVEPRLPDKPREKAKAPAQAPQRDQPSPQEGSSESESSSEEDGSSEEEEEESRAGHESKEDIRARVIARIKKRREEAEGKRSKDDLRSPVICVLGHVDTGKTKILDKIRKTHVQDGEAGGITQQIGATQVPASAIINEGNKAKDLNFGEIKLPGFLIIDTPGHESFSNLRSRGSSLCDIAILVVDIMHGIEPQTMESIDLLLKRKTPFIIALNKVDRLYNWRQNAHKDIKNVLKSQEPNTQLEFKERYDFVVTQFAEKGLNIALYWEKADPKEYYQVIPTSAHSGDGMANLMVHMAEYCQEHLPQRLAFSQELDCTVLEVKTEPGLGRCIDVVLVNGTLRVQDIIVVAGLEGPIVTQVRELLMPQPLKELRVKNPYEHFKEIKGAQGVRILGKDLDKALAGLPLLVAHREDEVDVLRQDVSEVLQKRLRSYRVSERGVYVQASTLGSLEALLAFLDSQKISYCGINIGPVHRKDVMKTSTMLEHDPQWAVILAFDVTVDRDAQLEADKLGVKVMTALIIYHLQDKLLAYREELRVKRRQEKAHLAIFPCKLRILPSSVFNKRDPIVLGVSVEAGQLKPGTPLCVPTRDNIFIGTISSIENNHKQVEIAKAGMEVCIKIENTTGDAPKMYDRHFNFEDILISKISRETIDVCKAHFREDLSKEDWRLIVELKKLLDIY